MAVLNMVSMRSISALCKINQDNQISEMESISDHLYIYTTTKRKKFDIGELPDSMSGSTLNGH